MPGANLTPLDVAASIDRVLRRNIQFPDVTVTAGVTAVTALMRTVLGDATAGVVTANLPSAVGLAGMRFTFKKVDSSLNTVGVIAFGGETIDGVGSATLNQPQQVVSIESDGANWKIVSNYVQATPGSVTGMLDIKGIQKTDNDFSSLNPVPGTTIVFNTTRAGVSFLACSAYTSGFSPGVYSGTIGINVDGVDYTLFLDAQNNGSGGDFTSGMGYAGCLPVQLNPGVHTAYVFVTQSVIGFQATPNNPLTLSVIFPTATGGVVAAATMVRQQSGPFSATVNPPDTNYIPIAGSSIPVVLAVPQTVTVLAYTNFNDPGSNACNGQLGVRVTSPGPTVTDLEGNKTRGGNDVNAAGSVVSRAINLPAGSHTIELIARNPASGGSYEFENAWLTIIYSNPQEIAPTPEAATLVVHPTAGEGDFQTIEAALAELGVLGGGYILVREGTYTPPAGGYQMPNVPAVIRGCGNATIIDLGSAADAAFVVPDGRTLGIQYVFEDFEIRGDGATVGQRAFAYNESDSNAWMTVNRVYVNKTLETILDIQNYDQTLARYLRIKFNDCNMFPTTLATSTLVKSINAAGDFTGGVIVTFNGCVLINQFDLNVFTEFWNIDAAVDLVLNDTQVRFNLGSAVNGFSVTDSDVSILGGDFTIQGGVVEASHITDTTVFGLDFNTFLPSRIIFQGDFQPFVCEGSIFSVTTIVLNAAAGPDPRRIVGCYFPGAGTAPMALDIQTSLVRIEGCEFGDPFGSHTTQAVLLNNALDCTIIGCGFEETGGVATVVETGTSDRNTISGCVGVNGGAGMTLIGPSTRVEGSLKTSGAAATVDAYTQIGLTRTNPMGLSGVGTIKNTGANDLTVRISVTDAFGTSDVREQNVVAGGDILLDWLILNNGTARPPYVSCAFHVKSTVPGNPTTYSFRFTTAGATV